MPRRFSVILAADMVDYTLLMGEDEDATISLIRELREVWLEPVAERHGGEVLKRMGDGWIFAFPSVRDAVAAAVETQKGLTGHPKIRLRMGIHLGDIVEDQADIYGAGVNLAARLQTEAPPGGVMISADIHRQLSVRQAEGFVDAGTFKLKNIVLPVQGFQWRLDSTVVGQRGDEVPVIAVEGFAAAPMDGETTSAAADLRDQIVHGLTHRTGLKVLDVSREDAKDATYALRGRLRRSGGRARANLSLVFLADGSTCWAELYESEADDLYAFCDNCAAKMDGELRLFINSLDNVRIVEVPDESLSVSELRTRGAGLSYDCSIPALERCSSVMARARRLNPDDGMAHAMWATAVVMLRNICFAMPDEETVAEVGAALDRAVELLPRSDFVFFARSWFRASILRDAEKTMADARRGCSLNPNYPQSHVALGYGHILAGDFRRAVREFEEATQIRNDPHWAHRVFHKAVAQFCSDDHAGTLTTLQDLIDLKPTIRGFRKLLILTLRSMGDDPAADREEATAHRLPDEPSFFMQETPLPPSHLWLRNVLAPGSG